MNGRSCPPTWGLGIAGPLVIKERPRALGGPLERSFRSGDGKFRRLGSAAVVVSIKAVDRRWIGDGYFVQHLVRWCSRGCGAAVPWAAPPDRNWKDHGEGHISSSTSTTVHSMYNRPLSRVCTRLHSCEITLDMSQPGADCCFTITIKSVRRVNNPAPQWGTLS